jgi:AAA15 family ATPase/GTPase
MLKNFHIERPFLGFKDFHIGEFTQFNLIVGDNGAGKSALLEAIRLSHPGGAQLVHADDTRIYPHMPWTSCITRYSEDWSFQKIVLIDEIEQGIHHTNYQMIWEELKVQAYRHSVQIFATTHSYEFIEAVCAIAGVYEAKDICLFRLEIGDNPMHSFTRYDVDTLGSAIEHHMEVR